MLYLRIGDDAVLSRVGMFLIRTRTHVARMCTLRSVRQQSRSKSHQSFSRSCSSNITNNILIIHNIIALVGAETNELCEESLSKLMAEKSVKLSLLQIKGTPWDETFSILKI